MPPGSPAGDLRGPVGRDVHVAVASTAMPPAVARVWSSSQCGTSPTKNVVPSFSFSDAEAPGERAEPQEQLTVRGLAGQGVADRRRHQALGVEQPAPEVVRVAGVAGARPGLRGELADLPDADVAEPRARDREVPPSGDTGVVAVRRDADHRVLARDHVALVGRHADLTVDVLASTEPFGGATPGSPLPFCARLTSWAGAGGGVVRPQVVALRAQHELGARRPRRGHGGRSGGQPRPRARTKRQRDRETREAHARTVQRRPRPPPAGGADARVRCRLTPAPCDREEDRMRYEIISADTHILEPPDIWKNHLAKKFQEHAPTLVKDHEGGDAWQFVGGDPDPIGLVSTPGKRFEEFRLARRLLRRHPPGLLHRQGAAGRHGHRRDRRRDPLPAPANDRPLARVPRPRGLPGRHRRVQRLPVERVDGARPRAAGRPACRSRTSTSRPA